MPSTSASASSGPSRRTAPAARCNERSTVAGLRGENLLAILPTGAGKSLCYQLPALAHYWRTGKLTVIVSPLQSLMKDQVDNLVRRGIYCAVALNGLLTPPERRSALEKIQLGDAGIVLVSPEQFRNKSFIDAIRWREIAAWVFDEAHCLSKWGHDFRTDYLYVATFIRERYGGRCRRLPASRPPRSRTSSQTCASTSRPNWASTSPCIAGGHARANLEYEVVPVTRAEKPARVLELLRETLAEGAGGAVVFTATRKNAETMAELIAAAAGPARTFTPGSSPGTKREIQQSFVAGSLRVIVATNAFGMGVDKPDVRLVVHADIPGSLENYLQEAGRAGRDSDAGALRAAVRRGGRRNPVRPVGALPAHASRLRRRCSGRLRKRRKPRRATTPSWSPRASCFSAKTTSPASTPSDRDAETKVKTAIAWLERARLVRREQNADPRVLRQPEGGHRWRRPTPSSARADLADDSARALPRRARARHGCGAPRTASRTDEIMVAAGIPADECFRTLHNLEALGLARQRSRPARGAAQGRDRPIGCRVSARVSQIERALVDVMAESAPDADSATVQVGIAASAVRGRAGSASRVRCRPKSIVPERLLDLLRAMAQSFGAGAGKRAILTLRKVGSSELRVRVQRPWSQIREITAKRRSAAQVMLQSAAGQAAGGYAQRRRDRRMQGG